MSINRLPDYIEHMQQAASDACVFTAGLSRRIFLRTSARSKQSS